MHTTRWILITMSVTFLGVEPYTVVGIALSSDVLVSAVSAYTYGKHRNLDIKKWSLYDGQCSCIYC